MHAENSNTIYRLPTVLAQVGFSESTLERMEARGEFPKRIKLSQRCIGWRKCDIELFIAARAGGAK